MYFPTNASSLVAFSDHNVITKTYAIHGVNDVRGSRRLTFAEAVHAGILDAETGAYTNSRTGERMYVGDAIKQGFIKASVVNDPKLLDIAPGNKINLAAEAVSPGRSNGYHGSSNGTNGVRNGSTNGY